MHEYDEKYDRLSPMRAYVYTCMDPVVYLSSFSCAFLFLSPFRTPQKVRLLPLAPSRFFFNRARKLFRKFLSSESKMKTNMEVLALPLN